MKWPEAMDALLEDFKCEGERHLGIVLRHNKNAQYVAAIWPRVFREIIFPEGEAPKKLVKSAATWALLWNACRFSMSELAVLAGLPDEVAERAFEQCRGAMLIYPDGDVARITKEILTAVMDAEGHE